VQRLSRKEKSNMFNLVAINVPDAHRRYAGKCHKDKCPNEGRYQLFGPIDEQELPDWEGKPICSKHLVAEARLRPEITMSLIDILIDTLERHHMYPEVRVPESTSTGHILPFQSK
jgi:hypothetical protein